MLTDAYGNPLHTTSQTARDAYVEGMTGYLEAHPGVEDAFQRAIDADEGFALAMAGKARNLQVYGHAAEASALMAKAMQAGQGLSGQARGHLEIFDALINGRVREGYARVRAHLVEYPRDALVAATSLGVFSLIGFSGELGREAENLALAEQLAPAYGEDGWFLSQLAFAQIEVGQLGRAHDAIETSLSLRPRSAHGAHIRAHLFYEEGQTTDGLAFLSDWMKGYDRAGGMHCHNAWHIALWALATGDVAAMWRTIDADLLPENSQSPPLNVLTDLAAVYFRAEMAGLSVSSERWKALSEFAAATFPDPGLGFADVHSAIAYAMAGDDAPLLRLIEGAKGPAADIVGPCASAFRAVAAGDWTGAEAALVPILSGHERLGGSRAQRDILDYTLLHALIRQGKADEARRLMILRRPLTDSSGVLQGL